MAGFEISATAARQPRAATTASVREVREGGVGILAGDAAVDGIDAMAFRAGEKLPEDAAAAREAMTPWLQPGFWNSGDGTKFASFMLGVALHLERPVAVIQRQGKTFFNPVRIYGARDASGALLHSVAKPNAPETVPTFKFVPFADLVEMLRTDPICCSVVEWNGSNHFDPWLLKPSLRAAAEAAAESVPEAAEAAVETAPNAMEGAAEASDGVEPPVGVEAAVGVEAVADELVAAVEPGEVEAALVDDEWVSMPGGPWTARLMRKARQPADTAPFRVFGVAVSFDPEHFPIYSGGAVKFLNVRGAPADGIVCQFPATPVAGSQLLMFPLCLSKEDATDDLATVGTVLYRKKPAEAGSDDDDGVEAAVEEGLQDSDDDDGNDGGMAAAGGDASNNELPQCVLDQAAGQSALAQATGLVQRLRAQGPLGDDAEMGDADAPPQPPQAAQPPSPRPRRERKRKERYGDNGELEGPASSFRSAPAARKASVEASLEMGVPAYALPGEEVWAMGLHAGARKRFKAEVVGLRKQFPRIIVKYVGTEDGNTNPLALPEMKTAYLCAADIEPSDW